MSEQTTYVMFHQQIPVTLQAAVAAAGLAAAAAKEKGKDKPKATTD